MRAWLAFLAAVLVVAGVLKTYALVADGDTLLGSGVLLAAAIGVELVVATWLAFDHDPERARRIGLSFFTFLALVALGETLTGQANCGCFGPVRISPWFTLAFDLTAVAALLLFGTGRRPDAQDAHVYLMSSRWLSGRTLHAALPGLLLSLAVLAMTQGIAVSSASRDMIILEPQQWLGQPLPILDQTDIRAELARGMAHNAVPPRLPAVRAGVGEIPGGCRAA